MGPFGLITSKFGSMPKAVQVFTYLIFVCLVVYLYLSPRVITGQIVATTENGGFVPYRGIQIQTHVQGHLLKFRTNEFGYWTIPLVNRLPDDVTIQVFHEDDKSWVPVTLKGGTFGRITSVSKFCPINRFSNYSWRKRRRSTPTDPRKAGV